MLRFILGEETPQPSLSDSLRAIARLAPRTWFLFWTRPPLLTDERREVVMGCAQRVDQLVVLCDRQSSEITRLNNERSNDTARIAQLQIQLAEKSSQLAAAANPSPKPDKSKPGKSKRPHQKKK